MPPYRPMIQAGFAPAAPNQPRLNPAAFGGEGDAIQGLAAVAQDEIRFRTEAHQATQLASARATAQTEINDFLQEIEQNPDFTTYPAAWAEKRTELETQFRQSLDPLVWSAFESDWITMSGSGNRSVRDLAYARESDHLIAALTTSQSTLIEQAGRPGVDHAGNVRMIQENYLEAFRAGLISETDAVRFAERDARAYRETQEYAAIGRDPVGWLQGHGAAPSAGPVAVEPGARDHVVGGGIDGIDASGNAVPAEMRPVFEETLDRLNAAGRAFGEPIRVSNVYRSPEHNTAVSGAENSQHVEATAADVIGFASLPQDRQIALVQSLVDAGFTSFGFYGDGSMHVDRRTNPAMWAHTDGENVPLTTHTSQAVVDAILDRRQNPQPIQAAGGGAPVTPRVAGNIDDLATRPRIPMPDGSTASVLSFSIGIDDGEVLIPSVVNGEVLSQEEATRHYHETGEHLGIFDSPEEATAYSRWLSENQSPTAAGVPQGGTRPPIPGLTPQQNEALYNRAERLAHQALERARVAIGQQVDDYQTAVVLGMDGVRPSAPAVMGAYATSPAEGAAILDGLDRFDALSATFDDMHDMSNPELQAFVVAEREALTAGGQEGITERAEDFGLVEQAADRVLTAREDGAAYVTQRDPDLAEMFETAETPEDWAAAIALSVERQRAFVSHPSDIRPLPQQHVGAIMEAYGRTESPEDRVAMLMAISANDAGALVFDQLEAADLDPAMRYVVEAADRIGLPSAAGLASILADPKLQEDYEAIYPTAPERRTADGQLLEPYMARLEMYDGREAIVGDVGQSATIRRAEEDAFLRIARGMAVRQRGTPNLGGAGTEAYERLFGGETVITEPLGFATVPADQAEPITAGMETARDALLTIDMPSEYAAYLGMEPEDVRSLEAESAWEGMVQGSRWVNYGDGYALAMPVQGPMGAYLPAPDGSVRVWSAADLAQHGQSTAAAEEQRSEAETEAVVGAARSGLDAVIDAVMAEVMPDTSRSDVGDGIESLGAYVSDTNRSVEDRQEAFDNFVREYGDDAARPFLEYLDANGLDPGDLEWFFR